MTSGIRLFVVALMLLLAGCGYHLRGSDGEFKSLPPTFVRGGDLAAADLRQFLRTAGTDLVDDEAHAKLIVVVANVARERRVLSVGTLGRVQEYELIYSLTWYGDDSAGHHVLDEQVVKQSRNFSFDATDVSAKSNEEDYLFRDMQRNAVMQIVRRLQVADFSVSAQAPDQDQGDQTPPDESEEVTSTPDPASDEITAPEVEP
ncbi:MAG: LPS assembly lipoprotein LptE [Chromatiales bacterium]|jgi:LPS-assembly lipoprotein|nr:LPS assembly lipoprotein LptE [Chromatiales bacterium]